MLKKISISPESTNYLDNPENIAYLYRGYIIWKRVWDGLGEIEWNYGEAVLHTPDRSIGEDFEAYWDDDGDVKTCESRRDCVLTIDYLFEAGLAQPSPDAAQADQDDEETVTITVSKNQARAILAALSRRREELESLGGDEARDLADDARAVYQSVDSQAFSVKS